MAWKCNLACGTDKIYYQGAQFDYTDMCGATKSTASVYINRPLYETTFTGTAYVPANIFGGDVFTIDLKEGHYINDYINDNPTKTRYEWVLKLPTGITVAAIPNAKYGTNPVAFRQSNDSIFITSPSNSLKNASISLKFNCGSAGVTTFSYSLTKIDDSAADCRCQGKLICTTVSTTAFCPSMCAAGPSNYIPVTRRVDNSLGWTDITLATRQVASAISAFDLSKALFLDTIQITGTARQNNAATDLRLQVNLAKAGTVNKLTPIDISLKILRAGVQIASGSTTIVIDNSIGSLQIMDWNVTSLLPALGLNAGDSIVTISRYVVSTNSGLPQNDIQAGGRFFHYNLVGTVKEYCTDPVPEMYLVGTTAVDGRNGWYSQGCTPVSDNASNIARRFNTSGVLFATEYRPVFYVDSIVVTYPPSYTSGNISTTFGGVVSPNSTLGLVKTFINPGTWTTIPLTVTNTYGGNIAYPMTPTCKTTNGEVHNTKIYIRDFYYALSNNATYPANYKYVLGSGGSDNTVNSPAGFSQGIVYSNTTSPVLKSQNLIGTKLQHSWDIQVSNQGLSTAPYLWVGLEKVVSSGITIDSVVRVSTSTKLTAANYGTGNSWYQVSAAGVASAGNETVRIFFKYSKCVEDSIKVISGWNCSNYPSPDPAADPNACALTSLYAKVVPSESQVQIAITRQPGNGTPINLCETDSVLLVLNSAQAAFIINPVIDILIPNTGVTISNPIAVEYPRGSGFYENLTATAIPGGLRVNLKDHSGIGVNGIPGTLSSPTTPDRQAKLKVVFTTSCSHSSGSPLNFKVFADRPCGPPAVGDDKVIKTDGIHIAGVGAQGIMGIGVSIPDNTFSCSKTQTLTFTATPLIQPTQAGDTIEYTLPKGLNYSGSFVRGANCATCNVTTTPGLADKTIVKVALDPGVAASTLIGFSFNVSTANTGNCTTPTIETQAKRQIAPLQCGASTCPSSNVIIGSKSDPISIERAQLSFTDYGAANNYPYQAPYKYVYWGTLMNSATVNSGNTIKINTYFDVNQNGIYDRLLDSFIQSTSITSPIIGGGMAQFADSFTSLLTKPSPTRPLFSVVDTADGNCMCAAAIASTFLTALPVDWLSVDAKNIDNNISSVSWKTAAEYNNLMFEIYRSTTNAAGKTDYRKVGEVAAKGTTQTVSSYSFNDNIADLSSGKIFYKIKQIDVNGANTWSEVVSIDKKISTIGILNITPNPANNKVEVSINNGVEGSYNLTLIDMTGKLVFASALNVSENSSSLKIDVSQLPAGVYSLQVVGLSGEAISTKLMIQK